MGGELAGKRRQGPARGKAGSRQEKGREGNLTQPTGWVPLPVVLRGRTLKRMSGRHFT